MLKLKHSLIGSSKKRENILQQNNSSHTTFKCIQHKKLSLNLTNTAAKGVKLNIERYDFTYKCDGGRES